MKNRIQELQKRGQVVEVDYMGHPLLSERMGARGSAKYLSMWLEMAIKESQSATRPQIKIVIVSGEASHVEYSPANSLFRSLLDSGVRIEMVAGPVLSGDRHHGSIVTELARAYPKTFTFFPAPTREVEHWKVLLINGRPKYIQIECPHEPAPRRKCLKSAFSRRRYILGDLDGYEPETFESKESLSFAFDTLTKYFLDRFGSKYAKPNLRYEPTRHSQSVPVFSTEAIRSTYEWLRDDERSFNAFGRDELVRLVNRATDA